MEKVFYCTLMHKRYGEAIFNWYKALSAFERANPGTQVLRCELWGNPAVERDGLDRHKHDFGHEVVTRKYIEARELFLASDCDVFVAVEDDMVIPEDALIRLQAMLDGGADVAYSLYTWRHGIFSNRHNHWSAYVRMEDDYGWSIIADDPGLARDAFVNERVLDVSGVGLGCTAIKREVLEALEFHRDGLACNDWYFAQDCVERGFVQRCDFGLVCGHYALEPSPCVLYPDPDEKDWRRIEFRSPEVS